MPAPRRAHWKWTVPLAALFIFVAALAWSFLRVGRWLVVQDELEPAEAIVVLSGRLPERAREAAAIYRQKLAPQVWVTRPASAAQELKEMGIGYVGEEFYNQKVLMQLSVPAEAIRVLETPVVNTAEEVGLIAEELRRAEGNKIIIVTSKAHTRRVRAIWKKLVGASPQAIVRYTPADPFDGAHWWRSTQDVLDVTREVLGLANAWAGFPVRPEKREKAEGLKSKAQGAPAP